MLLLGSQFGRSWGCLERGGQARKAPAQAAALQTGDSQSSGSRAPSQQVVWCQPACAWEAASQASGSLAFGAPRAGVQAVGARALEAEAPVTTKQGAGPEKELGWHPGASKLAWPRDDSRSRREQRRALGRAYLQRLTQLLPPVDKDKDDVINPPAGTQACGDSAAAAVRCITELLRDYPDILNVRHVSAAVKVCVAGGSLDLAEEVIAMARATGGAAAPNCHVYTTLARGYCKAGNKHAAHALLERMREEGVAPDAALYNVLLAEEKSVEGLHCLLHAMKDAAIAPDERTFCAAIRCAGRAGDAAEAAQLWNAMRCAGVQPTVYTYSCLADVYARCGMADECAKVVQEMKATFRPGYRTPSPSTATSATSVQQGPRHNPRHHRSTAVIQAGALSIRGGARGGTVLAGPNGAGVGERRNRRLAESQLDSAWLSRHAEYGTGCAVNTGGTASAESTGGTGRAGPLEPKARVWRRVSRSGEVVSSRKSGLSFSCAQGGLADEASPETAQQQGQLRRQAGAGAASSSQDGFLVQGCTPAGDASRMMQKGQGGVPTLSLEHRREGRHWEGVLVGATTSQVGHLDGNALAAVLDTGMRKRVTTSAERVAMSAEHAAVSAEHVYSALEEASATVAALERCVASASVPAEVEELMAGQEACFREESSPLTLHRLQKDQSWQESWQQVRSRQEVRLGGQPPPQAAHSWEQVRLSALNCLMRAHAERKEGGRAALLLQEIEREGLRPSIRTLNAAAQALLRSGQARHARAFLLRVIRERTPPPSAASFSLLIQAAGHMRDIAAVREALGGMERAGCPHDAVSFRCAVHAFVRCGDGASALHMLQSMMQAGYAPAMRVPEVLVKSTEAALFVECTDAAERGALPIVLADMARAGLSPSPVTAANIVRAGLQRGGLEHGVLILQAFLDAGMPAFSEASSPGLLASLASSLQAAEPAGRAAAMSALENSFNKNGLLDQNMTTAFDSFVRELKERLANGRAASADPRLPQEPQAPAPRVQRGGRGTENSTSGAAVEGGGLLATVDALLRNALTEEVMGPKAITNESQTGQVWTSPSASHSHDPNHEATMEEMGVLPAGNGALTAGPAGAQKDQQLMDDLAAAGIRLTAGAVEDIITRVFERRPQEPSVQSSNGDHDPDRGSQPGELAARSPVPDMQAKGSDAHGQAEGGDQGGMRSQVLDRNELDVWEAASAQLLSNAAGCEQSTGRQVSWREGKGPCEADRHEERAQGGRGGAQCQGPSEIDRQEGRTQGEGGIAEVQGPIGADRDKLGTQRPSMPVEPGAGAAAEQGPGMGRNAWLHKAAQLVLGHPGLASTSQNPFVFTALMSECLKLQELALADQLWDAATGSGVDLGSELWLARINCLAAKGQVKGRVREILLQVASSNRRQRMELDEGILRLLLRIANEANDQDGVSFVKQMLSARARNLDQDNV